MYCYYYLQVRILGKSSINNFISAILWIAYTLRFLSLCQFKAINRAIIYLAVKHTDYFFNALKNLKFLWPALFTTEFFFL